MLALGGYMGPEVQRLQQMLSLTHLHPIQKDTNAYLQPSSIFVREIVKSVKDREAEMRRMYLEHNQRVIDRVPEDKLLIWNVKGGWEPLCKAGLGIFNPRWMRFSTQVTSPISRILFLN